MNYLPIIVSVFSVIISTLMGFLLYSFNANRTATKDLSTSITELRDAIYKIAATTAKLETLSEQGKERCVERHVGIEKRFEKGNERMDKIEAVVNSIKLHFNNDGRP